MLETIRIISELAKSVWDFSLAKVDIGVALGYSAAREVDVMR